MSKIALIVPFRNRESQLKIFEDYFKKYLKEYDYKIFVIEQSNDNLKFNRGILLNIGFKCALEEGYNTFIYSDVDLLPPESLKEYYTKSNEKDIIHIAFSWNRYNQSLKNISYFGGITRIPANIFKKIGGFPTLYWGWGGEDDEVYRRVLSIQNPDFEIIRPNTDPKDPIKDLEGLTLEEKFDILKKNELKCHEKNYINEFYKYYRSLSNLSGIFLQLDNLSGLLKKGDIGLEELLYKKVDHKDYEDKNHMYHSIYDISGSKKIVEQEPKFLMGLLYKYYPDIYNSIVKNNYIARFTTRSFIYELNLLFPESDNNPYSVNKEFPWFKQRIFHAGSESQFLKYSLTDKLQDPTKKSVLNTFKYMFEVIKKGIYIQIKDNVLVVFLPFSNAKYINTWSKNLKVPRWYTFDKRNTKNITNKEIIKLINDKKTPDLCAFELQHEAYSLTQNSTLINLKIEEWYANNYFFRNTVYNDPKKPESFGHIDEGDKSVYLILKFFIEMLSEIKVPDTCFFVNARDMPILKIDKEDNLLEHPYPVLFPGYSLYTENKRLNNLYSGQMVNIYSGAGHIDYSDIKMPTDDDIKSTLWKTDSEIIKVPEWSKRIDKAIFRGSVTGRYTDIKNLRIQIAFLSKMNPELIDASFRSFNKRLKVIDDMGTCDYIDVSSILDPPKRFYKNSTKIKIIDLKGSSMDMSEQVQFKYTIDVQGHSAAYRLPKLLSLGFVVLKIDSEFSLWFENDNIFKGLEYQYINDITVKDIHFIKIPVIGGYISADKLFDSIKFLKENDKYAKIISENAVEYYNKFLNKQKMFEYFVNKL